MTSVPAPDITLQKRVLSIQEMVAGLKILSNEQYSQAAEISKSIAAVRKEIEATFDPIIAKAHAAHKEACTQKSRFLNPLIEQQRKVDILLLDWSREQERVRRQREEELTAKVRREQEQQALREAQELEDQGEPELANVVLENQIAAPAPVVSIPSIVPKVQGFAKRTNWRWRIKNSELIPRAYMMPDEIAINGVVRSLKDKTAIPGIEVFSEESAMHRS